MTALVKGFGRRPFATVGTAPGAGAKSLPRRKPRGGWGDRLAGAPMGIWSARTADERGVGSEPRSEFSAEAPMVGVFDGDDAPERGVGLAAGARLHLRPAELQARARAYRDVTVEDLRANLIAFVREIAAVAEEEGARLAIHPDDPAFPIFGLPRVMSTAEDVRKLFAAVPSSANGLTLCAGSFGSNPENDLVAMAKEFGPRIHFAHLRNVKREPDGSFFEADHLAGETDMVRLVAALMAEEDRRRARAAPTPKSRCAPTTGTCSATTARSASTPAIRSSAASRAWRNCAA